MKGIILIHKARPANIDIDKKIEKTLAYEEPYIEPFCLVSLVNLILDCII